MAQSRVSNHMEIDSDQSFAAAMGQDAPRDIPKLDEDRRGVERLLFLGIKQLVVPKADMIDELLFVLVGKSAKEVADN